MTVIEDARAAADALEAEWLGADVDTGPEDAAVAALRALIAEHEATLAASSPMKTIAHRIAYDAAVSNRAREIVDTRAMFAAVTVPPTDDEREALYDGAWKAISGRDEAWGGCAERDKVMRVAEFAAGFHRPGPITNEMVAEAWAHLMAGGGGRDAMRAALEAAERARCYR